MRRVIVIPGPSCGAARAEVLRGLEAAAGPRVEAPREGAPFAAGRDVGVAEREGRRPGPRRALDEETGRLADRGAPGRLEVIPKG